MSPDTFREALLATARVACCAALLQGCTASTATTATEPTKPEPAKSEDASVVLPSGALPAKEGRLAQCRTVVAAEMARVKAQSKDPDADPADGKTTASASVKECCQTLAEAIEPTEIGNWKERTYCCRQLEWRGSVACTPWGPPVPPAMPRVEVA